MTYIDVDVVIPTTLSIPTLMTRRSFAEEIIMDINKTENKDFLQLHDHTERQIAFKVQPKIIINLDSDTDSDSESDDDTKTSLPSKKSGDDAGATLTGVLKTIHITDVKSKDIEKDKANQNEEKKAFSANQPTTPTFKFDTLLQKLPCTATGTTKSTVQSQMDKLIQKLPCSTPIAKSIESPMDTMLQNLPCTSIRTVKNIGSPMDTMLQKMQYTTTSAAKSNGSPMEYSDGIISACINRDLKPSDPSYIFRLQRLISDVHSELKMKMGSATSKECESTRSASLLTSLTEERMDESEDVNLDKLAGSDWRREEDMEVDIEVPRQFPALQSKELLAPMDVSEPSSNYYISKPIVTQTAFNLTTTRNDVHLNSLHTTLSTNQNMATSPLKGKHNLLNQLDLNKSLHQIKWAENPASNGPGHGTTGNSVSSSRGSKRSSMDDIDVTPRKYQCDRDRHGDTMLDDKIGGKRRQNIKSNTEFYRARFKMRKRYV